MSFNKSLKIISTIGMVFLVSACSVTPKPISMIDRKENAKADLQSIFLKQPPLEKPLTLYSAQARGLVYNLDHRIRRMEEAVASGRAKIGNFDMLPEIVAQAGYSSRNNLAASYSRSVATGRETLEPSYSQDKSRWSGDLGLSWNLLDFGVSYFQARQNADRILIAEERRRKVVQNLLLDIRYAFWRAAAAQQLESKVKSSLAKAENALKESRKIAEENLQPALTTLKYQQSLLDIIRQLETLDNELSLARTELATLINLPPNSPLSLEIPEKMLVYQAIADINVDQLEDIALLNRPELYEADYNNRIAGQDARKELVKMLPGLRLTAGGYFDDNSFTYNNTWGEAGAMVSWNLVDFMAGPTRIKQAKLVAELSQVQRIALSVAILSQVRIAHQQYISSVENFDRAQEIRDINQQIADYVKASNASDASNQLAEVRSQATAIFAELREFQSYAMYQNALGRVYSSIGLNPAPMGAINDNLDAIENQLQTSYTAWNAGNLPKDIIE